MYSPSPQHFGDAGGAFAQPSPDYGQGPPRKKMRKGTKSCIECRRRKIKCTFEPGRPAVCNECYARGSSCIDQEHGETTAAPSVGVPSQSEQSYSLRERVTQLEGLVREVLNRLPEGGQRQRTQSSTPTATPSSHTNLPNHGEAQAAAEALKNLKTSISVPPAVMESGLSLPGGRHEDAPVLSLFDNAVISTKREVPSLSAHQHNKSKRLLQELRRLLPSPKDLDLITDAAQGWWDLWQQMFPVIGDPSCRNFKEVVSYSLRSDRPAELAKIILCIAITMDQMPVDFEKRLSFPCPARDMMEHAVNVVDQLITSDDEIGATLEGIECMVLEGKFHVNLGRPRRAWLIFRRAAAFAQLIGLHRIGNHPIGDDVLQNRQQSVWQHLFQGDRYLSLILGLPYCVSERFCSIHIPSQTAILRSGELYLLRISPLMTKLVDRNQDPDHMSFATTLRIDAELDEIAHSMPQSWWQIDRDPNLPRRDFYDRLMAQFFHHQIRTLIHLPFMLKSSSDKRYHYSHQAALESSREMIRYFSVLRETTTVGAFVCKLVDFQAFTAAMLILLNLMGYSQTASHVASNPGGPTPTQETLEQNEQDWVLIDETIGCLQRASAEAGGIVAAQSAKALELLSCCRDKAAECDKDSTCKIQIPFFGTITIGPASNFHPTTQAKPAGLSKLNANGRGMLSQLPTPPASTGTQPSSSMNDGSTQPSPASAILPSFSNPGNSGQANGQASIITDNDHFVSFDGIMGLPQTDFTALQSSTATEQNYGAAGSHSGLDSAGTGGMGWGYPIFGVTDLDQGWNWTGDGNLAAEWTTGLNTGLNTGFNNGF